MSIYYVTNIPYSSELYHHGIKGQKWGVRRFQNPDGSLTAAGERRYGSIENFNAAQKVKAADRANDRNFLKAVARTGLATNITKAQREKTRQAFSDYKNSSKELKEAKKQYKKTNNLTETNESRDTARITEKIKKYNKKQGVRLNKNGEYDVKHYVTKGVMKTAGRTALTALYAGAALETRKRGMTTASNLFLIMAGTNALATAGVASNYRRGAATLRNQNAEGTREIPAYEKRR